MQCARHPRVETFVQCGRCERPICPDCMVPTPVGVKCRDCSRPNLEAIMTASPQQHALAALCGFGSSAALGWMPHMLLWLGIIYGYLVGEATLRGGGRRRGPLMQVIAGTAAAVGFTVWGMIRGYPLVITQFVNPWDLIGLGLGVFFAVMRVRYI